MMKLQTFQVTISFSLKNEVKTKLIAKADSLEQKILPCERIELSSSKTLIFNVAETDVSLSDSA